MKYKLRRLVRKRRRQVEDIGTVTEKSLDRHIFRRLMKVVEVKRFVFGWVGLIALLIVAVILQNRALAPYYQENVPASGGLFREGIVGTFTNASPLYAQNSVDSSASRLIFSGLFKYDKDGKLVPDLAEKYEVDATETLYTVHLKKNTKWHDGKPLTAKDVVFTFNLIKNPEVRSYLLSSWRGIDVRAKDDRTITFKLPNSLSAFKYSLTTGIVPEHILSRVAPNQLRSSSFNNQSPVGSGPFKFQTVEAEERDKSEKTEGIAFAANQDYHLNKPKLEKFIIRTYEDDNLLAQAFNDKAVDAMAGLSVMPENISASQISEYNIPLTSQVMVFFKNSQEALKDPQVRKALVLGVSRQDTLKSLPYSLLSIDSPILKSHTSYDASLVQKTNDKKTANSLLDSAGWVRDPATKVRKKDGKTLKFRLFSAANSEFTAVSGSLQKQWRELGVEVEVVLQPDEELQSTTSSHNYDALLYGISVGPDPDVLAYWHSTQADVRSETRLNLSEYKSATTDRALEAGRTRSDAQLRKLKYRPFLEAWRNDAPALALYQPRFLYVTNENLNGFDNKVAHTATDRYSNIENWTIRKHFQNK